MASKKKQLMSVTVYHALRKIIIGRRFQPGQRVNVEELARELGVSRTPVWEAIRRLEQERILQNIPNRGVFMAERSLGKIKDILDVRNALDSLAGKLCVKKISRSTFEKLSRCLDDELKAIESGDVLSFHLADVKFHCIITESTGNQYLNDLYESITAHVYPAPNIINELPSLYLSHKEILSALSEGNPGYIERTIAHHGELLMSYIRRQIKLEAEQKEIVKRIKEKSLKKNNLKLKSKNKKD
ncbi:MAG: GntR family transcriptional regulator [Spirochaetes bacterium]|nr:GntR family transcriptional regulator [Spirochaetota bacterium]